MWYQTSFSRHSHYASRSTPDSSHLFFHKFDHLTQDFLESCMTHPTHMRLITINMDCVLIVMWYLIDLKGVSAPYGLASEALWQLNDYELIDDNRNDVYRYWYIYIITIGWHFSNLKTTSSYTQLAPLQCNNWPHRGDLVLVADRTDNCTIVHTPISSNTYWKCHSDYELTHTCKRVREECPTDVLQTHPGEEDQRTD